MARSIAFARLATGTTLAGALLVALPAAAQDAGSTPDCASLPNPVYFTGSTAFDPTVGYFAVKLSALGTPITLIYNGTGSCDGVAAIGGNTDLTGTAHFYKVDSASGKPTATGGDCTLGAGTKADVAVSDVFWTSCTTAGAQPATVVDYGGPAQAMEFVVPEANTTNTNITFEEAQLVYGCGMAGMVMPWTMDAGIFYRSASSGTQITIAKAIGVAPGAFKGTTTTGTGDLASKVMAYATPGSAIGFLAADAYESRRSTLNALAFRGKEQMKAYYPDSDASTSDRRNVRDGHYLIWGYEHMFAASAPAKPATTDVIKYIVGTKTDPSFDYVTLEAAAGTIPLCAMKVTRTTDGGDLSYSNRGSETCDCAFEAAATKTTPASCPICDDTHACAIGLSCHHGYCE